MRRALAIVALLVLVAALGLHALGRGFGGQHDSARFEPVAAVRPEGSVVASEDAQREAARALEAPVDRQILFGDLHVHTTISFDAFMLNLPATGGTGAATPADACDFARHCAGLDFFSFNDHAANILPGDWTNTVEAVRACNARADERPDTVAFLGWEWTQAGPTPETHYGHKNVVIAPDAPTPPRPIAASRGGVAANPPSVFARGALALTGARFRDMALRWTQTTELPLCPESAKPGEHCRELAETPERLFAKLDAWGHEALVIPHGTTWGIYTPPGSGWAKQLRGAMHDPERQTLFEVYSGHGDGEVFREWRAVEVAADGTPGCPAPRDDYLPMCHRAGEIVRARCLDAGESASECDARAAEARRHAAAAGVSPQATVPGATAVDWLDAGQCRDCGQPAFSYRPGGSAQALAALGDFSDRDAPPRRFRFGFIASSDIHVAKPGTGYKELRALSETRDLRRPDDGGIVASFLTGESEAPAPHSRSYEEAAAILSGLQLYESERTRSFLYTGGLVAVHAMGRDRNAIWQALQRKEVYGTSGPRMLLWFDALVGDEVRPMGSEFAAAEAPTLRVRAVGSREQIAGCPVSTADALGPERLASLCHSECHRPSDERRLVTHIEVIRIRPQAHEGEAIASLVDDPWQSFACPPDPDGCTATFVDEEFATSGRDTVYYARVHEAPVPTVNGDPLRCERDDAGRCLASHPCREGEECLDPYGARAWSSPIYVDYAPDDTAGSTESARKAAKSSKASRSS